MEVHKLTDVKNNLSQLISRVRQGERIRISVHGKPVADLVPIAQDDNPALEDSRLAALERQGLVRVGSGRFPAELMAPGPSATGIPISETLAEERREGW